MTSEPNRPLAGISLPQWVKARASDRYDLEGSAFSPPNYDDGFFLIRYNKSRSKSPEKPVVSKGQQYKPIGEALIEAGTSNSEQGSKPISEKALQQHTGPCQEFIPLAKYTPREFGLRRLTDSADNFKSTGVDDGFKGDAAACGYSVLQLAQSMISGKMKEDVSTTPKPPHHRVRRNSKSLPASPLSSPKSIRKNPFFTDPIFGSTESTVSGLAAEVSKMMSSSTSSPSTSIRGDKTLEDRQTATNPAGNILRAKPSQLREMNFWSPTSM